MNLNIYKMPLSGSMNNEYRSFLLECGLRDEEDADLSVLITDDEGLIMACGSLAGNTIKQLAVASEAEGQGVMAEVLSALISEAASRGIFRLFLCTKPANSRMFGSMGFYEIVSTEDAVLMENRKDGIRRFLDSVPRHEGVCGAVVCNCDPFTLGHRHLIRHAAENCDSLYVFAVSEAGSMFTPEERLDMIRKGTADIPNCHVYESNMYLISRATFPAYFIKDTAKAEAVKADLDIELFAGRIAPALGITKRFAGQEPADEVTREYNKRMSEILPAKGIDFEEIPRLTDDEGAAVSAGRVRSLIRQISGTGNKADSEILQQISKMVPETTYEVILKHI
ncbi:MAG: [Mogibacterium sp.]|nr:[citrate (pro-3S)-lyase] ligase [Mogibacterium sp.]